MLSFVSNLDAVTWDDTIINGLGFIEEHVLQVPLFLMTLMRYVSPTLDNLYAEFNAGQLGYFTEISADSWTP
jgi:hypothetical protein